MRKNKAFKLWIFQRARSETAQLGRRDRLRMRLGAKIGLGPERWEGWKGDISVYLFRCPACGEPTIDYPHGFDQNRYLNCYRCGERIGFVSWRTRLAEFWETIRIIWRYRS